MWLLNTSTFELKEFIGDAIPGYAILSHTWGEEEVSFRDMRKDHDGTKKKAGYAKVEGSCAQARMDGLEWIWIDTCCIDKKSSAELSEAINSMYKWYGSSIICYVYLVDVPLGTLPSEPTDDRRWSEMPGAAPEVVALQDALSKSRWFQRGWTLQELVAPSLIHFYAQDWSYLGRRYHEWVGSQYLRDEVWKFPRLDETFMRRLALITGVDFRVLAGLKRVELVSVADRMAWASLRKTTREEDIAYSLMGLFNVNMPILYGEGLQSAFSRLQEEIISKSPDQSILVHQSSKTLALSPSDFTLGYSVQIFEQEIYPPFRMTNAGLEIKLQLCEWGSSGSIYIARLRCYVRNDAGGAWLGLRLELIENSIKSFEISGPGNGTVFACKHGLYPIVRIETNLVNNGKWTWMNLLIV